MPNNAGSKITAYTIAIRQKDLTYTTTSCSGIDTACTASCTCTIPIATLKAAPYILENRYSVYATVLATNAYGSSAASPYGNGAILSANPVIPSVPAAPTTSVNSNTSVTITWVAPSDGGSPITAYTVAIKNSVNTFTAESINCNVSTTTCTVPIFVLQAAPYNLAWGASIYATVLAKNLVGSSAESAPGNGALIVTNPDPPISLASNAVITSASVIALTWTAPVVEGGTAVLDYRVSWDQGTGTYDVIASGIPTASYSTTSPLAANVVYKFKVESRNAFGFSTIFSNEVSI